MGVPSRFGQIQADAFLGSAHDNSPFGKIWYVDGTNGSDGNAGDAPDQAYATVAAAIASAVGTRGDSVVIYPGTYTITSALVPKAGMTFRAAIVNPHYPSVSIRGNIANLVTVDVDYTRWIGFEFRATGSTARDLIALAGTTAVNGVTFEDCVFNGDDKTGDTSNGVCGIQATDATTAPTGLVVRRCLFRDLGKTAIDVGVLGIPYAKIEDNTFALDTTAGIGISLRDTGAVGTGKAFVIRNNEFIGPSATTSTTVGIVIGGTLNTTAIGIIRNNYFSYCATSPITQDKTPDAIVENYLAANNGGTLADGSST